MAHWEDLMELDSDSYMTPNSTMTQTSPTTETAISEVESVTGSPIVEDTVQDPTDFTSKETMPSPNPPNIEKVEEEFDDEDSGGELEPDASGTGKRPLSESKKARRRLFSSWIAQRAESAVKDQAQGFTADTEDDITSRKSIPNPDPKYLMDNKRDYQSELFERAKKQNIIAVLDTGSGKTLIAVLLLDHIIRKELQDRSEGKPPKISFFLVDSVTLVFQQFAVLDCNLDCTIERFCGEMGCDLWSKETWQKHFKDNMVIVCTAEILYQCLWHSFISIDQINLLIFDEAHHAKKNHAYARILKEFYIPQGSDQGRPKIFGMTASPVDAKQDPVDAAKELEALLDSQIATAADLSLVRASISRPEESVMSYARLPAPYLTSLARQLKAILGDLEAVQKLFAFARQATSELGEWCADRVWRLSLSDDETEKIEHKTEKLFQTSHEVRHIEVLDKDLKRIREARDFVKDHWDFPGPELNSRLAPNNISSKVSGLWQYLDSIFHKPSTTRCMIFVRKRYTARVLMDLFTELKHPNLRLGLLIGTRKGDSGDVKISYKRQLRTLREFKDGEINCLFATSVAEEGLDIPDCNVVIRFDLYDTLIQYIQSRGRARHRESKYIHLVEHDNKLHAQALKDVHSGEAVMRRFCEALPADRLLQGNDCDLGSALAKEKSMRRYTDPVTKATLTYASSLVVLAYFVNSLRRPSDPVLLPTFIMSVENKRYVCEVILPDHAPIKSAIGRPASRKSIAKRSAAFEMCFLLRQANHLDGNLLSTMPKYRREMANAHIALDPSRVKKYSKKLKPSVWEKTRGLVPDKLYLTVFYLAEPENNWRPSQPIAIVTRSQMPDFPPILLHLPSGKTSQAMSVTITKSITTTASVVEKLNHFTLHIWRDIYAKKFESDIPNMSYWFAPILGGVKIEKDNLHPAALIDWVIVDLVSNHNFEIPAQWMPDLPHTAIEERFIFHLEQGARRFYSAKVDPTRRPSDPVPEEAHQGNDRVHSILQYSILDKPKNKYEYKISAEELDQPVVQAALISTRRNWLDEINDSNSKDPEAVCYICPKRFKISPLPIPIVVTGYFLASIMHRVEAHLITLEACDMLGLTIEPSLALEAMTKDSDNTEEHGSEQIHVQRGMGKNYERLEFIGDCFLKMATSISLFSNYPDEDEFTYHVNRMCMISNKNLLKNALEYDLPQFIRSKGIDRSHFYPEGIKMLAGKLSKRPPEKIWRQNQNLGDKSIADVCEALIGAALLSYQDTGNLDMAVKAVTAMVKHRDHEDLNNWSDYWKLYHLPEWQTTKATAQQIDMANQIEQKMLYRFEHPRLLRSAFMHPSYPSIYEKLPSYQRLEFLGDSLLDTVSISFLFHRHPDKDPQWLTEHKMAMVSNKFLAALAVKLGFHKHLRCGSAIIEASIRKFVEDIEQAIEKANGSPDYWTTVENPPKCLSDVVESYVGAVFVDSRYDYQQVEHFFERNVRCFFEDMKIYDTFANNHPMTHLMSFVNLELDCRDIHVMSHELPSIDGSPRRNIAGVMIHDRVIAEGSASSGKNAKLKAALRAIEMLQGIGKRGYRETYGCNCQEAFVKRQAISVDETMVEGSSAEMRTNGFSASEATVETVLEDVGTAI